MGPGGRPVQAQAVHRAGVKRTVWRRMTAAGADVHEEVGAVRRLDDAGPRRVRTVDLASIGSVRSQLRRQRPRLTDDSGCPRFQGPHYDDRQRAR
jgi:hypothetical protein